MTCQTAAPADISGESGPLAPPIMLSRWFDGTPAHLDLVSGCG